MLRESELHTQVQCQLPVLLCIEKPCYCFRCYPWFLSWSDEANGLLWGFWPLGTNDGTTDALCNGLAVPDIPLLLWTVAEDMIPVSPFFGKGSRLVCQLGPSGAGWMDWEGHHRPPVLGTWCCVALTATGANCGDKDFIDKNLSSPGTSVSFPLFCWSFPPQRLLSPPSRKRECLTCMSNIPCDNP